jgi:hypothetical protein
MSKNEGSINDKPILNHTRPSETWISHKFHDLAGIHHHVLLLHAIEATDITRRNKIAEILKPAMILVETCT